MTEEEAKNWVKDKTNQQRVVDRFFADYKPVKSDHAVFMAGIPGAGKTEFAENFIEAVKLLPIEHDKLVEYIDDYRPENYNNYRKAGSVLVSRILDECLKNGYGFIFDGTLSHDGGYRNIEKALEKNFIVRIFYIVQEAKLAWRLTQDRELVKKRAIEKTGFEETCTKINNNLLGIFARFKDRYNFSFIIVDKNGEPGMNKASMIMYAKAAILLVGLADNTSEIEKALSKSYNLEELG
jgi:hypothetical protein